MFLAAAQGFSARGYDGIGVDEIARVAGVNKAMIYYHFTDKVTLYREIVRDMLREAGSQLSAIANDTGSAADRLARFIDAFVRMKEARPWMPTLMLREMSEGAPHLDMETLGMLREVFGAFARILGDGRAEGRFRDVQPPLAYLSVIAPILLNDARERAGRQPGRRRIPLFAKVSREDLVAHVQQAALGMLMKD